jgi:hypothetical protein
MVQGRLVAAIVVGVAALSGCASQRVGTLDYNCPGNGAICMVEVTVDVSGDGCRPRLVDPAQNVLKMPRGERNVVIRWVLDRSSAAGYEFQDDGFDLKSGTTNQFPSRGAIMGGRAFQVINAHTNSTSYEYYLLVHRKSSAQVCKLDPFINNVN